MTFKPLGYKVDITSTMSTEAVKRAIRSKKKGWFSQEGLPRGWIVGPFLCMWQSAINEHGPMVFARIKNDGFQTRIVGRAGADLNGTMLFVVLTPLMAWITWKMYETGQGDMKTYIIVGLVFGVGLPLTLWLNSKDRRDADALVEFLAETVGNKVKLQS